MKFNKIYAQINQEQKISSLSSLAQLHASQC